MSTTKTPCQLILPGMCLSEENGKLTGARGTSTRKQCAVRKFQEKQRGYLPANERHEQKEQAKFIQLSLFAENMTKITSLLNSGKIVVVDHKSNMLDVLNRSIILK